MHEIKKIYRNNYKEMVNLAQKVEELWESRVYKCFKTEAFIGIKFRKYLAPEGGYRIRLSQWESLDEALRNFFMNKVKQQNDWIYFRGYGYYALDEVVHRKNIVLDNQKAIAVLSNRWKEYQRCFSIVKKLDDSELSLADYFAVISFLEWIWNDYSTITWISLQMNNEAYENKLMEDVDKLASVIIDCTFGYILNSDRDYEQQFNTLAEIFCNEKWQYIYDGLIGYLGHHEGYVFRSMREGDQLWMVLVNCEIKLIPWIKKNHFKKVLLLNNAFGAINTGYLLKHMCDIRVDVINIYASVHEEEMNRYATSYNSYLKVFPDSYDYVVIIDDSIFTGRSVKKIKQIYSRVTDAIACLVLTYDVATYFNHPEEMNYDNDPLKSVLEVEGEVRRMEGLLTPARSYWAYKKDVTIDSSDNEYEKNIRGSDLLIRILWRRFEAEIKDEHN